MIKRNQILKSAFFVSLVLITIVTVTTAQITLTARTTGNWNANDTWISGNLSGTITTSTGTKTVTGSGTSFTTQLAAGAALYRTDGTTLIGVVATVNSNTSITLVNNANNNNSGASFRTRKVPGANDDVVINSNNDVTVTANAVSGSITLNGNANNASTDLTINQGFTLTIATDIDVTAGNGNRRVGLAVNGTIVIGGAASFTGSSNATYSIGVSGTFEYNGSGQTVYAVPSTNYENLTISGSGTKTLNSNITVDGTLAVKSGATLSLSSFNLGTPSALSMEGGGASAAIISGTGTLTVGGNISVTDNGAGTAGAQINCVFNLGATRTFTVADDGTSAADLTINGTFNNSSYSIVKSGAGTLSFGSQAVAISSITISAGALTSTSGTLTISGDLTNNSTFNHNNGTVLFNSGGSKSINGSATAFYNLNVDNSTVLGGNASTVTVNNTLNLVSGSLDMSGRTLVFQNGNIPVQRTSGTITTNSSTNITFGTAGNTGGSAFTLPSAVFTSVPSINNFTINRSNFIELGSQDLTINGSLTLTSGVLSAGSNTVTLASTASFSGGSNSSHVNGNLKRFVPASANPSLGFPIGDGTSYTPVTIAITGTVTAATGSMTIRSVSGDHPSLGASGINNTRNVNRYWVITNNTSIPGMSSYAPSFTYASSDNDGGTTPSSYVIRTYNGSSWTAITVSGIPSSTNTSGTGVSVFGDFVIGQITGSISVSTHPVSTSICEGSNVSFTAASASTPAPTVKWQRDNGGGFEDITSVMDGGIYSGFTTGTLSVTGASTSINSYTYQAVFTNINGTVASNSATLTVNPVLTPTATLTMNGSSTICSGSTVLFTTIAGNTGGGTVTYNFKVNGSSVQSGSLNTYSTSALAGGDVVSCDITIAGGACLTSTTASSNTNFSSKTIDVQNPTLSISANTGNSICSGTTVLFTATASNVSATSLTYSFKKNGTPVQTGINNQFSTSSLSDNDVITCEMTLSGGTCSGRVVTSNSVTMTVNPSVTPTVTISATPGSVLCAGTPAVFSASVSNTGGGTVTSYNFKVNGTSVQNSASNSFTINSPVNGTQVTCDVNVSGGVCSAATASSNTVTLSVAAAPTVTINSSVPGSVCSGTSVTYTASASNVSGATLTYNFRVNGASQQNSASASFVYIPANNDVVDCIISLAGGTCSGSTATSNSLTANVVSSLTPTVSISVSPGVNISSGATVTFTATTGNTGGGTITYVFKVNGTTAQSGASSTFAVSTLANGDQVTCDINIAGGTCLGTTTATSNAITISVTSFVWIGTANTNWNNTNNWSGGAIPTNGASILIQSGAQHHPVINNGTITANNITLQSGTSLTVSGNGVLQVAGTISNAGLLSITSGTIEFNGSTTQTVDGNLFLGSTVKNIRISNNVTLTGVLNVTGIVSFGNVNNKTLASAGYLVLKSSSSATAIVTDLTNSNTNTGNTITGNVVVERYIPASRKWRAISTPLKGNTNNSIFANWQNNGIEEEGTGVSLWSPSGSGAAGNGFSLNSANGSSANIRGYGNGAFTIPTSTKTSLLFDNGGPVPYLVFATDQYTNASNTSKMYNGATATTLKATGNLITGTYTINSLGAGFRMIGNPYAAPVDFATIGKTNINNQFWIWDPKLSGGSGYGGYVYTSNSGGGYVSAPLGGSYTSNSTIIQPGSAFWVKVNDGFVGSLTFNETDKKTTGTFNIYGRVNGGMNEILRVNLTSVTEEVLDGIAAAYHQNSSVNLESSDAVKFSIGNENISIRRFSKDLAIEFRPLIETRDTIFIRLNNMQQKQYNLVISGENFNVSSNLTAVLQDLYLNNETPINIYGQQMIPFTVTGDAASTGDRFRIVFRPSAVTPVTDIQNQKGFRIYPNPVAKGMDMQFELKNMVAGKYQVTITDIKGARITSYSIQHGGGNATHSMKLPSVITAGTYIAEIRNQKGETEQVKLTVQ